MDWELTGAVSLLLLFFCCAGKMNLPISIVYVPSHLYHMLFELFKVGQSTDNQFLGDESP